MANVLGLGGLNTSGGTDKLIAAYGNDLVDVDVGTGFSLNLTSTNNNEFAPFLDSLFWQNYNHTPLTYDGSTWTRKHVSHTPISKYLKQFSTRMYLGNIKLNSTAYPSRVWYSDLPAVDASGEQTIQWGYQSGSNGSVTIAGNQFVSKNAGFNTFNVKPGDRLIIESGANTGQYTVSEAASDQLLSVSETFKATQSNITYWVGGNWFDVRTDNNDVITWLGENSDRLLIFKQDSLHRFDLNSLRTVTGSVGTTSGRSVINIRGATIYFHGSIRDKTGFYLYDGRNSIRISNKIQPFIDGISASNYNAIVSWREGDEYRAWVGDISNSNSANSSYNIILSNAVFSYDVSSNTWTIDPINDVVKCAGKFRENNQEKFFFGNDSDEVIHTPSGYNFNGDPIPMIVETRPIYPKGSEIINVFTRIKIVSRDSGRVSVLYKLWDTPFDTDQTWTGLGQLQKDTTELLIPTRHNKSSGIQFRFEELGSKEPVPVIEKISVYSYPFSKDTPELHKLK